MDMVTITLPVYAARYLVEMCKHERDRLSKVTGNIPTWTIGAEASYDSLNAIESSIPSFVDTQPPRDAA
jgi:hypothetical protein